MTQQLRGPRPGIPHGSRPVRSSQSGAVTSAPSPRAASASVEPEELVRPSTQRDVPQHAPPVARAPQVPPDVVEELRATPAAEEPLSSQYERVRLLSNHVFYEWRDLSARKFDVFDQAKLARAVRLRNMTLLLDVLASTSNRDPRTLAVSDFRALALWHKGNSYLQNKMRISYTSIYGNRLEGIVADAVEVRESPLQKSRPEYLEAKARGFAVPTARDLETISSQELGDEVLFLFDKAQFIDPEPLADRIAELESKGDRAASITARIEKLDVMARGRTVDALFVDIEEFAAAFSAFGVQEVAKVRDTKFEPKTALAYLEKTLASLPVDDPEFEDTWKEARAEYERIKVGLEREENVKAKIEEVPLTFNQWTMFPYT